MTAAPYHFRRLREADLPLLARWRALPHVAEWWGEPDVESERAALADPAVAMWIVEHHGRPFAYAQDYDPHASPSHHFGHLPPGSRGIDMLIGEVDMLGRGHGAALARAHVERLLGQGAPAVGTDPHPGNARALHVYAKAGFVPSGGPVATPWGEVLLLECRS